MNGIRAIVSAQKSVSGNPKLPSREVQLRVLKRLSVLVDGRTIYGMKRVKSN